MKLTISLQVTLDGVAQANGGNNEEMDPGFTRGGWARAFGDTDAAQYILDTWRRPDAFLLGRKTFGLFETYWGGDQLEAEVHGLEHPDQSVLGAHDGDLG